uniref:Uncharacterized protein n=1 Tax=Anguilla anguilla TaxID=7936 RepID=A0A0E9W083_ANGAN
MHFNPPNIQTKVKPSSLMDFRSSRISTENPALGSRGVQLFQHCVGFLFQLNRAELQII